MQNQGLVHFKYFGDIAKAKKLAPLAVKLLGLLKSRHRNIKDSLVPNKEGTIKTRYDLGPIGHIEIRVTPGGQQIIRLTAFSGEQLEISCEVRHGLVAIERGLLDPLTREGTLPSFFERFKEDGSWSFGPWVETAMTGSYKGGRSCLGAYPPFGTSIGVKVPGRYTGEMRKAMQVLAGMDAPIIPEFCFATTHGIWTGSDDSKWLVEISSVYGVRAKPFPMCAKLTDSEKTRHGLNFDYLPSTDPAAYSFTGASSEINLGYPTALQIFYTRDSFYAACGWAFSESGHEAQNTCWYSVPAELGKVHKICERYKIEFQGGTSPSGISVSLVNSGYVVMSGKIKVPLETALYESLVEFETSFAVSPPSEEVNKADIYVFYKGDEEVVVKHDGAEYDETLYPMYTTSNYYNDNGCYADASPGANGLAFPTSFNKYIRNFKPALFNVSGAITHTPDSTAWESTEAVGIVVWQYTATGDQVIIDTTGSTYFYPELYIVERYRMSLGGYTETRGAALVIPFYDREAFYLYETWGRYGTGASGADYNAYHKIGGTGIEFVGCGPNWCYTELIGGTPNNLGGCLGNPSTTEANNRIVTGGCECVGEGVGLQGATSFNDTIQDTIPISIDSDVTFISEDTLHYFGSNTGKVEVYKDRDTTNTGPEYLWVDNPVPPATHFIGSYPDALSSATIAGRVVTALGSPVLMSMNLNSSYPAVCDLPRVKNLLFVGDPDAEGGPGLVICEEDL